MPINDSCGAEVDPQGALVLASKDVGDQLHCQAVVIRVGERFAEFGIEFDETTTSDSIKCVSKWSLWVSARPKGEQISFVAKEKEKDESGEHSEEEGVEIDDEESATINGYSGEIPISRRSKVVKVKASTLYAIRVRCFNQKTCRWSTWSPIIRTVTLNAVVGRISEIGEDYAKVDWDRFPRDTTDIAQEKDKASTNKVADIQNLELRVLQESNMSEVFCHKYNPSIRSQVLQRLHPGTTYIVLFRYDSMINTPHNWETVGRFYTQAALEVHLESCGEDVFSVGWKRGELPSDTVGYSVQKGEESLYQVQVENDGVSFAMLDLPSSMHKHRVIDLSPGASYEVCVRSVSKTGLWGCRSNILTVRTAEVPTLEVIATGECFTSFKWSRVVEEANSKVEFSVRSTTTEYTQHKVVILDEGAPHEFHVENLQPGSSYKVKIRTYLNGEWGRWTDDFTFTTSSMSNLRLVERGENFFTLGWPETEGKNSEKYNILVARTNAAGQRSECLDTVVEKDEDKAGFRIDNLFADTTYEVQIRTWQHNSITGFADWGDFCSPVKLRTLRTISLHLVQVGEDFISLVWHRGGVEEGDDENPFVKYEIVVSSAETDQRGLVHQQVVDSHYTITTLQPSTAYEIGVRACDEREQWGLWNTLKVRTLSSIVTSIHEIGEDFARLMWQRYHDKKNPEDDAASTTVTSKLISTYEVFVFSKPFLHADTFPHVESGYSEGGDAEVTRYEVVTSDHTSLRVTDLLPDREYVAVVRTSSLTGKKGQWSAPIRFRTNSQFTIPVNSLSIGENYVHLVWSRDPQPITDREVFLGDMTVSGQQLRIHGVSSQYSKDHTLAADLRELKIYGLSPACAYTIQLRVCDKSGHWGLWSPPVYILTRGTILTQAMEVAEDYAVIRWERRKPPNPNNYPTGKGQVTCYHLRVYNNDGIHTETFLGDGDCPYKITGLAPDTYYCVQLKANYNDEEWGMWSTPLWCLAMQMMRIQTRLISEEFCCLAIERPVQQRRLPTADGNQSNEDQTVAFGQLRPTLMLCVTTPILDRMPHTAVASVKPKYTTNSVPPEAVDHRLIYQTEIVSQTDITEHIVSNLKPNTVYCVSVRSKLANGEWGMWTSSLMFATVPTTRIYFREIAENYMEVLWKRRDQFIPPSVSAEKVVVGVDNIGASRVRVRQVGGTYQHLYTVEDSSKVLRLDNLKPSTTYAVSVQTYNDNYEWGVWSEESKARTVSMMDIHIPHISEDALWVSWTRKTDFDITDTDTYMNTNVQARAYKVSITGSGGFQFNKEMDTNALFFRGLQPDSVYEVRVRMLFEDTKEWGQWSSRWFRTQPRLRVSFGNIGEHFAILEWRRHLPQPIDPEIEVQGPLAEAEDVVQQFRFKVERVGDQKCVVYNLGPTVSSFRLKDLQPNSEYRVWMCAKGYEGVWGLWNEEARVRTLTKLSVDVVDIGEDYVNLHWQRGVWSGECIPNDNVVVRQVDGAVSGYEIRLKDRNGDVVSKPTASHKEASTTVSDLKLNSLYSVEIRAKDTYNEWGLWSEAKHFLTLKAVSLNLLRFGETFIDVEWARCGLLKPNQIGRLESSDSGEENEEDDEEDDDDGESAPTHITLETEENTEPLPANVILPDETVTQWHVRYICKRLFSGMPKEKEFEEFFASADEIWRRIESLIPDSCYTVCVRAKNKGDVWGHWSPPLYASTYPLLSVEMDLVGETFINMSWSRPLMKDPEYLALACFPQESEIHNYQVSVIPMASEPPFKEEDEPLIDGARVYETTQPSLRLGNLTSGTRYMVAVREQHVGDDGKAIEEFWGAFSEICYLETSPPLRVQPVEIGEDYCLVEWIRAARPIDQDAHLFVTPHLEKVVEFEIHTLRLNDDATTVYEGQLALDNSLTLPPSSTQYHIDSLFHATIYLVQVRGKGTSGTWGPWSNVMKFVTQSRLLLCVQAVYETDFYVSWSRPLPSWAITDPSSKQTTIPSPYNEVLLGDYSIEKYELVVGGISCSLDRCLTLENTELSTCINELSHNQIYSVCVRSLSQKQHWSMFSNKESLLTLQPMVARVAHYTEESCVLRWSRAVSDISEFAALLDKAVAEAQRQCDERERRDLYELKRRLQEMESRGEKVSGWIDQETRQEHNDFLRDEAIHHFLFANIRLGDTENTGFQLQLSGEADCCPVLVNSAVLKTALKKPTKMSRKSRSPLDALAQGTELIEESSVLSPGSLIDAVLCHDVNEVVVRGLSSNADYSVTVRSRNVRGDWQSWSADATLRTLVPITLEQSRFGEHYINLFWHRMDEELRAEMNRELETYKLLQSDFAQYTGQKDLEAQREGMSEEESLAFLSRLNQFKELHVRIAERKHLMADGKADLITHADTPVTAFQIRIIEESGNYLEYRVQKRTDGLAFTVTGLLPNCMYVCLLCPCYGENHWGVWTSPLKFMTQNLIQLKLTYVGESFVDIEWHRMANKQLPPIDRDETIISSIFSEEEQIYQLRIVHKDPDSGEDVEEMRDMKACNVFRVDGLLPDTKYTIAVREWDAKGDWGLWCSARTCVTLPGMYTNFEDIGEDWAVVSWGRYTKRIDYDNDMHVLQSGMETTSVYLRVVELLSDPEEVDTLFAEENSEEGTMRSTAELDISGFFVEKKQREGPLPPKKHPDEMEQLDGRYVLIRHLDAAVSEFRLENLKPDRFYYVQVISETTGGQLGMWSAQSFMLTRSKVVLTVGRIDEQYIDIEWVRNEPRSRPGLDPEQVHVGTYKTASYELEAEGIGLSLVLALKPSVTSFRLNGLSLNSVYIARVRSINAKSQISLWSDLLCAVTLKPVMVRPVQITESSMIIEWGRLEQLAEDYPPTETPLQMGSRESSGYHLRVGKASTDGVVPFLDSYFAGDVQQLDVLELTPNSAYVVCARASNMSGEWGLWSEDRCIHTMQLLRSVVAAVGEDYVRLCWERPPPDEIAIPADEENGGTNFFALQDQPEEVGPVYNSTHSHVVNYAILVRPEDESLDGEGYEVSVPGEMCTVTLRSLRADAVYNFSVHACYESGEWGLFSSSVRTRTYNLLSLEIKDAGEDYVAATWQRITNHNDLHLMSMGKVEETVCYEVGIYDASEVDANGSEEPISFGDRPIRSAFIQRKQRHCMIKDLLSFHRYCVAVRRWYEPHDRFLQDCSPQAPNTDNENIIETVTKRNAVPGAWSEADTITTLKDMVCLTSMIGENAFAVHWERDPRGGNPPVRKNYVVKPPLSYHIRIDELVEDGTSVNVTPGTFHVDEVIPAPESSFTAESLKPDSVYRVEVRASCVERIWGRWSKPLYIITQPRLEIEVTNIGEDCASLSWMRHSRALVLPDGTDAVTGDTEVNDKYQLDIDGVGFSYHLTKRFNGSRTTYTIKHLEANALYAIAVRSSDNTTNQWSVWSNKVHFATMKPLSIQVGYPTEQFVYVDWQREQQQQEDFADLVDGLVVLGVPDVVAYHLCVFQTHESPAVAVVDKQFHPDVSYYRVNTLSPDTPYVVIVRACYNDQRWGLWSQEQTFITQSLFQLQADGAGEDYVKMTWERVGGSRVTGVAQPSAYFMMLKSDDGVIERMVDASECEESEENQYMLYRFTGLEPGTSYALAFQPVYGSDRGMWSNAVNVSTLPCLTVKVQTIDCGVELHWGRHQYNTVGFVEPPQPFSPSGPNGDPPLQVQARTVMKYQLAACRAEDAEVVFADDENNSLHDSLSSLSTANADAPSSSSERETPEVTAANAAAEAGAAETPAEGEVAAKASSHDSSESEDDGNDGADVVAPHYTTELSTTAVKSPEVDKPGTTSAPLEEDSSQHSFEGIAERDQPFKVIREIEANDDGETGSCTLMDLDSDTRYLVRVRALDANGQWGCWTDNFITTPPPAPRGVVLRKVNAQFCSLQWEKPSGKENDYIYYVEQCMADPLGSKKSTNKVLNWQEADTVDETVCPIRITGSIPGLRCRIRCQHKGDLSNPYSDYSEEVAVSSGTPPEPVTNLTVVALSRYGATLEWTPPPRPDSRRFVKPSYHIYLRKANFPSILLTTVTQSTFTLSELSCDTMFVAQVVAENNDGVSYTNPMIRFKTMEETDLKIYVPEGNMTLGAIVNRAEEFREECRNRPNGELTDIPCGINLRRKPMRPGGAPTSSSRHFYSAGGKRMMLMDGERGDESSELGGSAGGGKRRRSKSKKKSKSKRRKSKSKKKGKKNRSNSSSRKGSGVKLPPLV